MRTAVLAVPVADVDRLTLAESAGRLVFALRNPRDAEVADESVFPAQPGVLKTSAHPGSGDALQDSTKAAAGVALDTLSGVGNLPGVAPRSAPAPHMAVAPTRVAGSTNSTKSGIEVIRGGRAETVAW